jgi:cytidylate kinase
MYERKASITVEKPTDTVRYRNITISGLPGTGTTTLLDLLRNHLGEHGWTGYSGGQKMREYVDDLPENQKRHHSAEDYDEWVDRTTDEGIRQELFNTSNHIIESWLSGFMAQGVPSVLKVLLICTNELDRAHRLAARDDEESLNDAMLHAFRRLKKNSRRWQNMYEAEWRAWVAEAGRLPMTVFPFFWHPDLYDLVIDTAVHDEQAVLDLVLRKLNTSS